VDSGGTVLFQELSEPSYRVDVGRGENDAWYSELVDLEHTTSVSISIPLTRVSGTLLVGSEPLRGAKLSFVDDGRIIRVWTRSEGRFAVDLPLREDDLHWQSVEIESEHPFIRTAIDNPAIRNGEMTLRIGNRSVLGEVVGGDGLPTRAKVSVDAPTGAFQIDTEDGSFAINGLPAGRISLRAFTQAGMTPRSVDVDVPKDDDFSTEVQLRLEKSTELRGTVRSLEGPITGAVVWCAESMLPAVIARIPTDVDGAFHFIRSQSAQQMTCTVSGAAFATRLMRLSLDENDQVSIFLTQAGTSLSLEVPEDRAGRRPFLLHDGGVVHVRAFEYLAMARREGNRISAFVEAGDWSLCMWTDAEVVAAEAGAPPIQTCKTGRAVPGGILNLTY
jgi:hypothetical protein